MLNEFSSLKFLQLDNIFLGLTIIHNKHIFSLGSKILKVEVKKYSLKC